MRPPTISVLLLALCFSCHAFAGLEWEQAEQVFHPGIKDTQATAAFTFINAGDRAVTITQLKSSCGCTTARLAKRTYQPGEQGVIIATFVFGKRQGYQKKTIAVTTDEPGDSVTNLEIAAHIPELLKIRPNMVCWKRGEQRTPKTISVVVACPQPVRVLQVKPGSDRFVSSVKTVVEGREYEISIEPIDTDKPVVTTLDIETDLPSGERRVFRSYSLIR